MIIEQIIASEIERIKEGIPVKLGKVYLNKSYRYLYPMLKLCKGELYDKVKLLPKLGVGIGDVVYIEKNNIILTSELFILVDTKGSYENGRHKNATQSQLRFAEFLNWFRNSEYLRDDYIYDSLEGHMHMLVLKIPEDVPHAIRAFVLGKYDMIYTDSQARTIFDTKSVEFKVVTNDKALRKSITNKIKELVGLETLEDIPGMTSKPKFEWEIFKTRKAITDG